MALSTTILENGRGILIAGAGEVTGGDLIAVKQKLLADEKTARKLTFGIVTLVDVTKFRISVDDVRELAQLDRKLAQLTPGAAVAVVAPNDHDFGVARMWEGMADIPTWSIMIFRNLPDAERWLRTTAGAQPICPRVG